MSSSKPQQKQEMGGSPAKPSNKWYPQLPKMPVYTHTPVLQASPRPSHRSPQPLAKAKDDSGGPRVGSSLGFADGRATPEATAFIQSFIGEAIHSQAAKRMPPDVLPANMGSSGRQRQMTDRSPSKRRTAAKAQQSSGGASSNQIKKRQQLHNSMASAASHASQYQGQGLAAALVGATGLDRAGAHNYMGTSATIQAGAGSAAGSKWKDLGEEHIVRAASIYANIPLSQPRKLGAVLSKAKDKSVVPSSHMRHGSSALQDGNTNTVQALGGTSVHTKKPKKKAMATLHAGSPRESSDNYQHHQFPKQRNGQVGPIEDVEAGPQPRQVSPIGSGSFGRGASTNMVNSKQVAKTKNSVTTNNYKSQSSNFYSGASQKFDANIYYPGVIADATTHQAASKQPSRKKQTRSSERPRAGAGGHLVHSTGRAQPFEFSQQVDTNQSKEDAEDGGIAGKGKAGLTETGVITDTQAMEGAHQEMLQPLAGDITEEDKEPNLTDDIDFSAGVQTREEFYREAEASRAAYFGAAGESIAAVPSGATAASFQAHTRGSEQLSKVKKSTYYQKRFTAGTVHRLGETSGSTATAGEDQNLNVSSPTGGYNSKSAKHMAKQSRKKDFQRGAKLAPPGPPNKACRKKINALGQVYDQKSVMVPAINGAPRQTSTQELRAMNGYGAVSAGLGKTATNMGGPQRRATNDLQRRVASQSPSLAYEPKVNPKMNQLVADYQQPGETVYNNTEKYYAANRGDHERSSNCTPKHRHTNNGSISARSDKNSLPEIGSRSHNDTQSFIETPSADGSHQPFHPSQPLEQSVGRQSLGRGVGATPAGEAAVSEETIALASLSAGYSAALESGAIGDRDRRLDAVSIPAINLPKIAKQATAEKVREPSGMINGKAGVARMKSTQHHQWKALGDADGHASRTQPPKKAAASEPKSPRGPRRAGPKRDSHPAKALDPIKIAGAAAAAALDIKADRVGQQRNQEQAGSGTVTRKQDQTLKPLNHTPVIKTQKQGLMSASKSLSVEPPLQATSSAKTIEMRKTQIQLDPKIQSLFEAPGEATPRAKHREPSQDENAMTPLEEKGHATLTNAKTKVRSPLRQTTTSLERTPAVAGERQGPRLGQKDSRETAIIVQSYNAEPFYRRAMKKLGWLQVPQSDKQNFHVRFNIGDLDGAAKDLQPRHFYNHFPQNRELVTKMGLCKNLWFNCFLEHEHRISHMFPRCYDLSVPQQAESFIADFNQTAVLSIIKIMATNFLQTNKDMETLLEKYEQIKQYEQPELLFKPKFRKMCAAMDLRSSGAGHLLGIGEVRDAYAFCKGLSNSLQFKEAKKIRRKFGRASHSRFSEQQIQLLVQFQSQLVEKGIPAANFPSYEQLKVIRLHQKLEQQLPQYRQIDGTRNIWIVKPSYNARGLGIYCTRQLREVLKDAEKTQQKVVQKYIEKPFCIDGQKKFDFRQWVLVNSWDPLDVSVFSSAYLKLCGSAFDLKNLGDVYRHLSNYSIQKDNGEKTELVMSSTEFQEFMQRSHPGFTWVENMLPKINDVVWRTLKGVQEGLEQKQGCFEVYGFDIVLDEDLNPWVIEVNLSPACNERAPWLTKMLDDSSIDLLRHVQSRILTANPAEQWSPEMLTLREQAYAAPHKTTKHLNPPQFYEEHEVLDRWVRLPESIQEVKDHFRVAYLATVPQKGLQLELVAERADLRYERKLDRQFNQDKKSQLIQRVYRGHLGRKIYTALLREKCSIIIQKYTRCFLAKCELIRLRQKRAATIVQKQLRRILAQKLAQRMDAERILNLKIALVTKLQTRYRMAKAKTYVHSVRQDFASRICQRYMRGHLAREMSRKERTKLCLIVRIQRFYKRRFRMKNKSARLVQKYLKGIRTMKKVKKLRKIAIGASRLLKTVQRYWKKLAVLHFTKQTKAVTIQSWFRMVTQQKRYRAALQSQARSSLRKILRQLVLMRLKRLAGGLKRVRNEGALTVQKRMRTYLAKKKLASLRRADLMSKNATLIKRFMKGYLGKKEAKSRRIKIGAAIMVQALYRGFAVRQEIRRQFAQWEQEQEKERQLQEQQRADKAKMRRPEAKRHSEVGSNQQVKKGVGQADGGRSSQNAHYDKLAQAKQRQPQKGEERAARYLSNPTKFVLRPQGSVPDGAGYGGGLVPSQSHQSIPRGEDPSSKFASQNSGKKGRKILKKGKGAPLTDKQHFELGLKHLQSSQPAPERFQSNHAVKPVGQKQRQPAAQSQDKRYSIQRVYKRKQEVTHVAAPARLGQRIASNLQNQRVEYLMRASNQQRAQLLPLTRQSDILMAQINQAGRNRPAEDHETKDSFDQRLNMMIQDSIPDQEGPSIEVGKDQYDHIGENHELAHAMDKDQQLEGGAAINSLVITSGKTPRQMGKETSLKNLHTSRSLRPLQQIGSHVRQSFELNSQIETQLEPKVVARNLGREQNVTAISTSMNQSLTGKGTATTVVMRKDPSKGSLHSARESSRQSQKLGYNQQQLANSINQNIITSQTMAKEQLKQTKEKSNHIKNLEKLVQHGAAYMNPTGGKGINRNTASMLREKITEQQKQLSEGGLVSLKSQMAKSSTHAEQPNKSFAQYLNEKLESQKTGNVKASINPPAIQKKQMPPITSNHQSNQSSKDEASGAGSLSQAGRGSLAALKVRQTEYKPVLAPTTGSITATETDTTPMLPEVVSANNDYSQNDQQNQMVSRTIQISQGSGKTPRSNYGPGGAGTTTYDSKSQQSESGASSQHMIIAQSDQRKVGNHSVPQQKSEFIQQLERQKKEMIALKRQQQKILKSQRVWQMI